MRIVRVVAALEPGGAQLSVIRLTRELRRHGIEAEVVAGEATLKGRALFEAHGVPVEVWGRRAGMQYSCDGEFARWLEPRLHGCDLVHAHMFGGWWAAARAIGQDRPIVASEHNALRWPQRPRLAEMREALRFVDLFFAHGPAARASVSAVGYPVERLREGSSAIAGVDMSPAPGLPRPRIVFAGRLHPEKGPDVLLEALALLAAPPITLVLGTGPLGARLRSRAAELGLSGKVRFEGWKDDPAPYIAGASVCVVPSHSEAWSQTAVLAMGLGVPVVGSAIDGLAHVLESGRGVAVVPGDPPALAAALDAVLGGRVRPDLAAARRYAARFTPERVSERYLRAYRELVPQPSSASKPSAA